MAKAFEKNAALTYQLKSQFCIVVKVMSISPLVQFLTRGLHS